MPNPDRIKINSNSSDARRAEAFLNSWEEPFAPDTAGNGSYVFYSVISRMKVELRFFDSYEEADDYGKQHFGSVTNNRRSNLNGSLLYAISGDNTRKVASLASHFAGKE